VIDVVVDSVAGLPEYVKIRIAFEIGEVMDVRSLPGGGAFELTARRANRPCLKDYDAIAGNRPTDWPSRFDVSAWGFFSASLEGVRVGGATVARSTSDLDMLEGRTDLAVLWDIRVAPAAWGQGVGTAPFTAAATWASEQGCRELKIETQDINVPACRFYAHQGCVLRVVHRGAYPLFPDELQLLWYQTLG
jgi:GNAT superfamily N-acetyltransferase